MHKILYPFVAEYKVQKIQELILNKLVKGVEDKGSYLLVETVESLDGHDLNMVKAGVNLYRCYEIKKLSQLINNESNVIPSPAPIFSWDLIEPFVELPLKLTYKISGQTYFLDLDEVLKILSKRIYNVTAVVFKLLDFNDDIYSIEDRKKALLEYLVTMTEHVFYTKHPDFEKNKRLHQLNKRFDPKFVKFWIKKHKISTQQLLCDHDTSDQYSSNGTWYNVVGTCRKCLINEDKCSFEHEECDTAYTYWKAALKNYKVKKEKV
jgi:hypothetical protein